MFRVSVLSLAALAAACTTAQAQEAPLAPADIVTEALAAAVRLKAQAETLAVIVIVRQQYETEVDKLLVDVQRALADLRARRQAERGAQNP